LRISEALAREATQSADVGEAAFALALVHRAKGDEATAKAELVRSVEALTNGLGPDHPLTREAAAMLAPPGR
jgi:hypothetical protein